ncbi:hypothetical protein N6H14_29735 [Paenibacillus sp. CC-CFT747]|nr:hypothetical protein N6H14_29735 [Paenibacillus sp. CC-CFT747]
MPRKPLSAKELTVEESYTGSVEQTVRVMEILREAWEDPNGLLPVCAGEAGGLQ